MVMGWPGLSQLNRLGGPQLLDRREAESRRAPTARQKGGGRAGLEKLQSLGQWQGSFGSPKGAARNFEGLEKAGVRHCICQSPKLRALKTPYSNHPGIFSNFKVPVRKQVRKSHSGSRFKQQWFLILCRQFQIPIIGGIRFGAKGATCFIIKNAKGVKEDIVQNLANFFCSEPESK